MIVFRLMFVVVLVTTVAVMIATRPFMLVSIVALFLELAVRVLAGFLAVGPGGRVMRVRGHGVLALAATGPTASISCGTD
ncbi:hypothetical protein AB0305_09635 [Arthrobacter sp. NPDC080086]|uniref:hypothetical protein n=1 Tax=Arthrobacter sp. NPDC080086 TaxID=3155917 RepID=UPI00344ED8A4